MDNPTKERATIGVSPIVEKLGAGALLYSYALVLGAAYIFGFWRPIGFNVFPYLAQIDYISAPLDRLAVLIATPALFAILFFRAPNTTPIILLSTVTVGYASIASSELIDGYAIYKSQDFYFRNEASIFIIAASLIVLGVIQGVINILWRPYLAGGILAICLLQIAACIASGYKDGKTIFNGADNVHFLENRELCEVDGLRDWVYLSKAGAYTFFMNTIDKRICVTDKKEYRLIKRRLKEGI